MPETLITLGGMALMALLLGALFLVIMNKQRFETAWKGKNHDDADVSGNKPVRRLDGDPVGVQRGRTGGADPFGNRLAGSLGGVQTRNERAVMKPDSTMTQEAEDACCGGCMGIVLIALFLISLALKVF